MSFLSDEHVIEINDQQEMVGILGRNDEFLRLIDASFDATVMARGNKIIFSGSEEENQKLEQLFKELLFLYRQGLPITSHDVRYSIYMVQGGAVAKLHNMYAETLIVTWRGHQIKAKTLGQWNYVRAIKNNFITFGIGPAGTGKTYLAVAMAVTALKKREVERIITLRVVDEHWMDHLDAMTDLRQGIGLRSYGQMDPVIEYKREGFEMFEAMINSIREEIVRRVFLAQIKPQTELKREKVAKVTSTGSGDKTIKKQPQVKKAKVGRNDPCPCGSGKKYKNCCLDKDLNSK